MSLESFDIKEIQIDTTNDNDDDDLHEDMVLNEQTLFSNYFETSCKATDPLSLGDEGADPANEDSSLKNSTVNITDPICQDITLKIKEGLYKLQCKLNTTYQPFWRAFYLIRNEDDEILEDMVCCRKCTRVFKYAPVDEEMLCNHVCRNGSKGSSNDMKTRIDMSLKIRNGVFKLRTFPKHKSKQWQTFALIVREDGSLMEDYICCKQCYTVLRHSIQRPGNTKHKCYGKCLKRVPIERDPQDTDDGDGGVLKKPRVSKVVIKCPRKKPKLKASPGAKQNFSYEMGLIQKNVEQKLKKGVYKLQSNPDSKADIWQQFAFIAMEDGDSFLNGLVCCRSCRTLVRYDKMLGEVKLREHLCHKDDDFQPDEVNSPHCITKTPCTLVRPQKVSSVSSHPQNTEQQNDTFPQISSVTSIPPTEAGDIDDQPTSSVYIKKEPETYFTIEEIPEHPGETDLENENIFQEFGETVAENENMFHEVPEIKIEKSEGEETSQSKEELLNSLTTLDLIVKPEEKMEVIVKPEEKMEENMATSIEENIDFQSPTNAEDIAQIIEENLFKGIYKLYFETNAQLELWQTFARILKSDQSFLQSWYYCRKCLQLVRADNDSMAMLENHPCHRKSLDDGKMEILKNITEYLAEDCLPLRILQGRGFRKLLNYCLQLGTQYDSQVIMNDILSTPSSSSVSSTLREMAEEKTNELLGKFKDLHLYGSISLELYPDNISGKFMLIANLHYGKNFEFSNFSLGVKSWPLSESKSKTIRRKLQSLLNKFGIEDFKNMPIVFEEQCHIKDALADYQMFFCHSHIFGKVLLAAINNTIEMQNLIKTCKAIKKAAKHLDEADLNFECSPFSGDNNSSYALIKVITQNWSQIKRHHKKLHINETILKTLQNIVELFNRLESVFKRLQATEKPSICFVIPCLNVVKSVCKPANGDCLEIRQLKIKILKFLEPIWLKNINIWHKTALFLYPPANQEQKSDIHGIRNFCLERIQILAASQAKDGTADNLNNNQDTAFFPHLGNTSSMNVEISDSMTQNANKEFDAYLQEHVVISNSFNVCHWWLANSQKYPLLSRLASFVLTIPASSRKSQRIHPSARDAMNEQSGGLRHKDLDNLLFLNSLYGRELQT